MQAEERMCAGDVAVPSRLTKKEEEEKEKGLGLFRGIYFTGSLTPPFNLFLKC